MMPPVLPLLLLPLLGHGPDGTPPPPLGATPPVRLTGFGDGLPLPGPTGGLRWPTPIPIPDAAAGNQG